MDPNANWQNLHLSDGQILRIAAADMPTGAPTIFDAVIDPTLSASDPSLHEYVNLTELVANESWAVGTFLNVGVHQPIGTQIVESGNVAITGLGHLALWGILNSDDTATIGGWDFRGVTGSSQHVMMSGLRLTPSVATGNIAAGAVAVYLDNCYLGSNFSAICSTTTGALADARGCYFDFSLSLSSGAGVQINYRIFDCVCSGNVSVGTLINMIWNGGQIVGSITISSSGVADVACKIEGNCTVSASSNDCTIHNTGGVGGQVVLSSTAIKVIIRGEWGIITTSGTPTQPRVIEGSWTSCDFTGPGRLVGLNTGSGSNRTKLRGSKVYADVTTFGGGTQCLALTDSLVLGSHLAASTFSLDATSARNLVILGGTHMVGWGGTTDSGTDNVILTDTSLSTPIALADGKFLIGNSSGIATARTLSGDVTSSDTGVTNIENDVALGGSPTTTTQSPGDNSTKIATTAFVNAAVAAAAGAITGEIKMWGTASAPTGYLLCDGSAVSRTTYAALFAIIGTTFGAGDGSTTFNVPDMRDFFPMGAGSTYSVGASGGTATLPNHVHGLNSHTHPLSDAAWAYITFASGAAGHARRISGITAWTPTIDTPNGAAATGSPTTGTPLGGATDAASGNTANPTTNPSILNPYKALTFIIKT